MMHVFSALLLAAIVSLTTDAVISKKGFRLYSTPPAPRKYPIGNRILDLNAQLRPKTTKIGPPQRKAKNKLESSSIETLTGRVSVYCVGSSIDLDALRAHVSTSTTGASQSNGLLIDDEEVLHVSDSPSPVYIATGNEVDYDEAHIGVDEKLFMAMQDIFYFEYGCVVFWGLTSTEERAALTELSTYTVNPLSSEEMETTIDTMDYMLDKEARKDKPLQFDLIRLRSQRTEEKMALTYAMAQSSKLFFYEQSVDQCLERTRYLPRELSSRGKISMSKKGLNKLIGELFVEQMEINLFSSILDTPDFLWEDEEYTPLYQYARSYLEVNERVELLNSRLAVIRELLTVLTAQVADSNSTRLEWIIIWLISFEIVLSIASNPLFAGRRAATALLVPSAILMYKKIGQ